MSSEPGQISQIGPEEGQIEALREHHAALERAIDEENTRPMPNQDRVHDMKKRKLRIKDAIHQLERRELTARGVAMGALIDPFSDLAARLVETMPRNPERTVALPEAAGGERLCGPRPPVETCGMKPSK